MDQVSPPTLDPSILEANLSALRQTEPVLADRLRRAVEALSSATPAVTRDGQPSFRLAHPQGRTGWFGRTSIPSVRAAALVDRFDAGQANVLLLGVGQGSEVTLLLSRLGRHRAVFVWEREEAAIWLTLHLHDWAQALTERRLVFVVCPPEQLTETLTAWLIDHPGHLCPARILMWPWSTPVELASCRASVQAAYHETERRRAEALASVQAQLAGEQVPHESRQPEGDSPFHANATVALLSLHAREETWALSVALSGAACALGWRAVEVNVCRPGDVHSLARARRLAEYAGRRPDAAVLLDMARHEARDVLPEVTPAISWLSASSAIGSSLAARLGPRDRVAVTSSRVRDRAVATGLDPGRLLIVPHPCVMPSEPAGATGSAERPIDLAIVADLGPTGPERFGHKLPTHTQLWRAALDLIEVRIETFTEEQGDSLFSQAEVKLGTHLEDCSIRRTMVEALSTSVANALLWRFLAQSLANNDIKVIVCGRGWADAAAGHQVEPAATLAERWQILHRAKLVLHADVTGEVSSIVLPAAAAGSVLLARSHPRDTEPGGLATLLEPGREMVTFARVRDLITALRRLLPNSDSRLEIADRAAARCRAEHLPEQRLALLAAGATSFSGGPLPLV